MKRALILPLFLVTLASSLSLTTCKEEENPNPFDDQARQQYEAILALQDESVGVLNDHLTTMDTTGALEATAQWFRGNSIVQSATAGSQGISVVYSNGIWGGLMTDGEKYDTDPERMEKGMSHQTVPLTGRLKNTPSSKVAHFVAASNAEFPKTNQYLSNHWDNACQKVGYGYSMVTGVTLDYLAGIQKTGSVFCFDSHGYAWPDNKNITEVYFKASEIANKSTTEKYYQDILDHAVILLKSIDPPVTNYYIGPEFITGHNDFSKDTVLFFGGFCYSFLGDWSSLADHCASGTWFGFDWAVMAGRCAVWAVDLIEKMADTDAPQPWTVEDWMTKSPIEKQYFNEKYNRTINIHYVGNSALILWEKAQTGEGVIEAVGVDGAPIAVPGMTCQEYTLRCKMGGQLPPQVSYTWDISEGHGKNLGQTGNELTCLYIFPGTHPVKVEVKNSASGEIIKEITGQVQLTDPSFLPNLQSIDKLFAGFDPNAVTLTDGTTAPTGYFSFDTSDPFFTTPLTWSDSVFSAQGEINSGSTQILRSLHGETTSDGKVLKNLLWTFTEKTEDIVDFEVKLELADIPLFIRDEWNCFYGFRWGFHGAEAQGHVIDIQYRDYDYQAQEWITIQHIDWGSSYLYGYFENEK